jgi:hypothetical protein
VRAVFPAHHLAQRHSAGGVCCAAWVCNQHAGGINEVRAQYAGFFFAAALVCGAALGGYLPRTAALVVIAVIFGGLIGGRLASLAIDRSVAGYGATIRALFVIDAAGFALALAALALEGRG